MKIRLIDQPFEDATDLRTVLLGWLGDSRITHVDAAVAWAKRSGLRFLGPHVDKFRKRGGELRLVIGVSAGGATRQGLELAKSLANICTVVYHSPMRTFHPKLYLASGKNIAFAVIGSQNLTHGGLVENFEVGVEIELNLTSDDDAELFQKLREIIDRYERLGAASLVLTDESLAKLLSNNRYSIGDEDNPRLSDSETSAFEEGRDEDLFGECSIALKTTKREPRSNKTTKASTTISTAASPTKQTQSRTSATPVLRWYKKMSAADAQHPRGANTNPTGHLTLVQAKLGIDHRIWFKDHLFAGLSWSAGKKQQTTITADVAIDGKTVGKEPITITFKAAFEAGQNNRTTVLHWGDKIGGILKRTDRTGRFVTIERFNDDTFALTISTKPTVPAIV